MSSPIRLLLLLEEGYPTRYWAGSLSALADGGIAVTFGTLREMQGLHRVAGSLGFDVFALNARTSLSYPRAVLRLRRIIAEGGFDVLHLSEAIQGAVGGIAGRLAKHKRILFHRHHVHIGDAHRLYTHVASRRCDMIVSISNVVARYAIVKEGLPESKIRVVQNGVAEPEEVPPQTVRDLRRELGIGDRARVITCVGVLRQEKGQSVLLDAVGKLHGRCGDLHVVIVGAEPHVIRQPSERKGPYHRSLREQSSRLALNTHFVGFQSDIDPWLAIADVVVVPSLREAFGLVAVEAMAAGKPLVSSAIDGLREVVEDGTTGLLVEPNNTDALAMGIARILEDEQLASKIGRQGRRVFQQRYTHRAMVEGWIRCYQELLA